MAEHQLPKLNTGVRFSSSALAEAQLDGMIRPAGRLNGSSKRLRATSVPHLPGYAAAMARRPWGNVRKLPSGRWQARYQVQGTWRNDAGDVPHQEPGRQLARGDPHRPRTRELDRPERRQDPSHRLRAGMARHAAGAPAADEGELPQPAEAPHPAHARSGRAGRPFAGDREDVASGAHRGGPSGFVDDCQGLPAPPRDVRDRTRGRRDRPQPVRHQWCLRRAPGRAPCRHDRADRRRRPAQ